MKRTTTLGRLNELLDRGHLGEAMESLRAEAAEAGRHDAVRRLETMQATYGYMLGFLAKGAEDPGRISMHADMVRECRDIADSLERERLAVDAPGLYYEAVRTNRHLGRVFNPGIEDGEEMFKQIWTAYPLTPGQASQIADIVGGDDRGRAALALSATGLGLLEFYDERRLLLLADVYAGNRDELLQTRAFAHMALALLKYGEGRLSKKALDRLASLPEECGTWDADVRALTAELLRTVDTERITRKVKDEIFPTLQSLKPEILGRFNINDPEETNEANPEWEELITKSGLADKFKELQDLQTEGSDVMLVSFSHLKSFPFFKRISSWFAPFSAAEAKRQEAAYGLPDNFLEALESTYMMCDSDKYSFVHSFSFAPEQQRKMLIDQFVSQTGEITAMMGGQQSTRRHMFGAYLHDLYRFYKLWPGRKHFYDPFAHSVDPYPIGLYAPSLQDAETMRLTASLALKLEQWAAADVYLKRMIESGEATAENYQQRGLCLQQLKQYKAALEAYSKADTLKSGSVWTLRRIAAVRRTLGQLPEALEAYRRIETLKPEDVGTALNIGHVLLAMGRYREAAKSYYKAEFLNENGTRHLRPLAWCLMLNRQPAQSRRYHDLILAGEPTAADVLNAGHNSLADNRPADAVTLYRRYAAMKEGRWPEMFDKDAGYLAEAGVDTRLLPLVRDAVSTAAD